MAGLPSDLDYTLKKAAPRGVRNFRTSLAPIGGISTSGFAGGDTIKYDIPTGRRGQFFDTTQSYLQIKVKAPNAGSGDIALDSSAYCFFQRLTVLSAGQILEDITEYANFVNTQIDNGVGPATRQTAFNIMAGTNTDNAANTANILRSGVTIAAGTSQNFTLPLVSGILGAQGSSKYLPIGAINSDLRIELVLHANASAVVNIVAAPGAWSITEANLMLSYIELDSEVQNMIDASTGGNYYISSETWRTYTNNLGNGSTADTILIPARFSSIKGLLHTFRPNSGQNNTLVAAQTHRYNPFFHATNACNVQYTIGPSLYPNSPIRSSPEFFAETQRYYHNLSNSNIMGSINSANFNVIADPLALVAGTSTAANVATHFLNSGAGTFAINLDQISNRSDVMSSGGNTLNSNVIMNMTYATPLPSSTRLDTYAHIDMVIVVENGILTVRV